MEVDGTPSQDFGAGVQQHLHQAQCAGVVEFDAGDFGGAARDGQREALKQGEINVYVQRLGLKLCKAVGNGGEQTAHLIAIVKTFVEAEVLEIVAKCLQPQKGGELLVHPHHRVLGVGA